MEIFAIHLSLSFFSPMCVFHEPIGKQNTKIMNTSNTRYRSLNERNVDVGKIKSIQYRTK